MTTHPKGRRIALVNAYVRENAGDAALLSVCIDQVRRAVPDADLVVAGLEAPDRYADFEGVPVIGSARGYVADVRVPKAQRIARRLWFLAFLAGYLVAPRPVRRLARRWVPGETGAELRAVAEADAVVSIGGGYVHAPPGLGGLQNLLLVLAPLAVAIREERRVVLMPQSFGPFRGRLRRTLVQAVLGRADLVCAREEISEAALLACGLAETQVVRAVDSGFALPPAALRPEPHVASAGAEVVPVGGRLRVGMTARNWLSPRAQHRYERAMAAVADELLSHGHEVVLIPQVTTANLGDDDRTPNRRIADLCRHEPEVVEDVADYRRLLGLYGGLDLLVGTRFHSVIFALLGQVPCVAVAYEHKTRGIMRSLGLEEWVVDIEDAGRGDRLLQLVRRAVAERPAYAERLGRVVPPVAQEADEVTALLREVVAGERVAS